MKKNTVTKKQTPAAGNINENKLNRPQNKNDLDSRGDEEQTIKGDDITKNRKNKKSENKK